MANKSLAATARKKLLRRGRMILRRHQSPSSRTRTPDGDLLNALTDAERCELEEIHGALERIERGIYGRCEVCGEEIARDRLEVLPWLRVCDACALGDEEEETAHEPTG